MHTPQQPDARERDERLESIIQSAMDPIITVDEEQKIVLFNAAAETTFRCPARDALGTSLDRFIPERYRAAHRRHMEQFVATGITMRRMGGDLVLSGLRADGEEFPIEASISQVSVSGRKLLTVVLRDITDRQRAKQELEESHRRLRELYESMHEVREAERTRVARELHDELAQWLTALKMDAAAVAARVADDAALATKMQRILGVINTTVAAVRRIAADLRPVMLDDLGLVPAIENLATEFSTRTGIRIHLDVQPEDIDVPEPHATAVYRMAQEALTNVARHAAASQVDAVMRAENGVLAISIRDDGRGLEASRSGERKSLGLLGIRERAQTLGGSAEIYSPPGGGTVVDIRLPLAVSR
jgi:two-component system sensor kinase